MVLSNNLYLMGKSFGVSVACFTITKVVSREGVRASDLFRGLILEAGFTSAKAIIDIKSKGWLPRFLFGGVEWPTDELIAQVRMPTLILHGDKDTTVPHHMA